MSAYPKPSGLAASLLILLLPGCATPIIGTDAKKVAEAIGHVRPSKRDTCETQQQAAEQSSKIDSIIRNAEVVYKADCTPQRVASTQPEIKR